MMLSRHFDPMNIQHMFLHWLHASENDSAFRARILPLSPCVGLVSMTDQKSSGDTRMSTNITNILWFPDMNHIHMVLQVILVNKEVPAYFTRNISQHPLLPPF